MIDRQDVEALAAATVVDPNGARIGAVRQVYVSHDGGQPLFVTVHTGLLGTKETFVPLQSADFQNGTLTIAYEKAVVRDAPTIEANGAISDDEQGTMFDYYDDQAGGTPAGVDDVPGGISAPSDLEPATDDEIDAADRDVAP